MSLSSKRRYSTEYHHKNHYMWHGIQRPEKGECLRWNFFIQHMTYVSLNSISFSFDKIGIKRKCYQWQLIGRKRQARWLSSNQKTRLQPGKSGRLKCNPGFYSYIISRHGLIFLGERLAQLLFINLLVFTVQCVKILLKNKSEEILKRTH